MLFHSHHGINDLGKGTRGGVNSSDDTPGQYQLGGTLRLRRLPLLSLRP
jgi:hypothetical protein